MKINAKIFNLPPYISTGWNKVSALHMEERVLIVTLINGEPIRIPNLPPDVIATIFQSHAVYLEEESNAKSINPFTQALMNADKKTEMPVQFGFSTFDGFGSAVQHNPAQADSPDLPKEILEKISAIAKIVSPEDQAALPKPEPHCNCVHCQIARAITEGFVSEPKLEIKPPVEEPIVTEEDLKFPEWQIEQTGELLYKVSKPDASEQYNVYLGSPVGCTCGSEGCVHILAVLKS